MLRRTVRRYGIVWQPDRCSAKLASRRQYRLDGCREESLSTANERFQYAFARKYLLEVRRQ